MTRFVPSIVLTCLFALPCTWTLAEAQEKPAAAGQDIPEEVREKLAHNIGCSFMVFRDKVQEQLKVTREQKEKLYQYLQTRLPQAMQALEKSSGEREKYNQRTHEEMAAVLQETLDKGQYTRLHQLELQRDGLFGPAWNLKELQITDEQRKQFMAPIMETDQKMQGLMGEIHNGANPDEIRPKALQLRLDLEGKLEVLLTDAQKKQWNQMLGEPVDASVLYGGVSSPRDNPTEAAQQRVAAKIERVQEGAHKWEADGRDTSAIAKRMEEKVKPLLEAGKFSEAEAELDRVLEVLNDDAKRTEAPTHPAQAPRAISSAPDSRPSREIIVSYADETKKLQLYRVNEDGSVRRRITDGTHDCSMPAWSPDGKQIVYLRGSENGGALWLSDPDGKNPKMLLASGLNMEPSWLPDSRHIVWFALRPGTAIGSQLNILNTETLEIRPLFRDPEQVKFSNLMPAVSPDGTKVAFVSNRSGNFRIWLSNLDGSDARQVSPLSADLDERLQLPIEQKVPSWSPDGRWIAHWEGVEMDHMSKFTGKPDRERDALIERSWNVWIVGSDGKNKRKAGHGDDPNWSPDGFVTRAFPDPTNGGPNVMIETKDGWKELPIVPPKTPRYGRFTWKP